VRSLVKGEHFGEIALINETKRTLSVLAKSDTLKLLALNRESFNRILGSIDRYLKKDYDDEFEKRKETAEVVVKEEAKAGIEKNLAVVAEHDDDDA